MRPCSPGSDSGAAQGPDAAPGTRPAAAAGSAGPACGRASQAAPGPDGEHLLRLRQLRAQARLALGQRRAEVAKRYLVNLGLNGSRITAISNGKEKPRALGHDEDSWRQNRRDDLIPRSDTLGMSSPR